MGTGGDRSRGAWTKRRTGEDTVKGKGQDLIELRGGPEVGWREVWWGGEAEPAGAGLDWEPGGERGSPELKPRRGRL